MDKTWHKRMVWALNFLSWSSIAGVCVLLDFTTITPQKITIIALVFVVYISGHIEGLCKGYFVP